MRLAAAAGHAARAGVGRRRRRPRARGRGSRTWPKLASRDAGRVEWRDDARGRRRRAATGCEVPSPAVERDGRGVRAPIAPALGARLGAAGRVGRRARRASAASRCVRRRSGGGAVLLVPGEVVWVDVIAARRRPAVGRRRRPGRPTGSGELWAAALAACGVTGADGAPRADGPHAVVVAGVLRRARDRARCTLGGRKVVGISQRRTRAAGPVPVRGLPAAGTRTRSWPLLVRAAPRAPLERGRAGLEVPARRAGRRVRGRPPDLTATRPGRELRTAAAGVARVAPPACTDRAASCATSASPRRAVRARCARPGGESGPPRVARVVVGWGRVGREEGVKWGKWLTVGGSGVYGGGQWGSVGGGGHRPARRAPPEAGSSTKEAGPGCSSAGTSASSTPRVGWHLPSDFRPRFEPRCYLAYGQDGCIDVMTPEAFEEMANETMDERQKRGELDRDRAAHAGRNAFEVAVDGQGRVSIDRDAARASPGSSSAARWWSSGAFDRVEIWHARGLRRASTPPAALALKGAA